MTSLTLEKVVFLDRDGVINVDSPDYIKNWAEFEFIPGSLEALRRLTEAGFSIIIISNQSAVNRGLTTEDALDYLFYKLKQAVTGRGGEITDIFYCPHTPEEGCACRKPLPGLIEDACHRYTLNPATACMIGDSAKDIECARAAGCGSSVLVKTGNGRIAQQELQKKGIQPAFIANDLLAGALWLINQGSDPAA